MILKNDEMVEETKIAALEKIVNVRLSASMFPIIIRILSI